MSSLIQGYKVQGNIVSIDFNSKSTHLVTGGNQSIKIFELKIQDSQSWFQCTKNISRYKGTDITKTLVKQLAWNKYGCDLIAIGTTSGYVLVFDSNPPWGSVLQCKGHQGIIYNVKWNTNSTKEFVTGSFDNYILQWDIRSKNESVGKYVFSQSTQIRQIKFSPFNERHLAAQSSTRLDIIDIRKPDLPFWTYEINDNQLNGNGVEWDPNNHERLASAISKKICIFDLGRKQNEPTSVLSHYSLIKSFHWMKTKEGHFGIVGESPQKNIFVYDIEDMNRVAYMYGGHNRCLDCWKMNGDQSMILSASNFRQRARGGTAATNVGLLVAQTAENYLDPNQAKFNYPISFDNNNHMGFCLSTQQKTKQSMSHLIRKKSKSKQLNPMMFTLSEGLDWSQGQIALPSLRQQLLYFYKNYRIVGTSQQIVAHNSAVALRVGKQLCSQFWKILFIIAFPAESDEHTIQSIYQEKLQLDIQIVDNRVTLYNKDQLAKESTRISPLIPIQDLLDNNQLQTAVVGALALINKNPQLVPQDFLNKMFGPYIQLLHNFQLYDIANSTIFMTKNKTIADSTQKNTQYKITCGWCKESVSKGKCRCNLVCVLCNGSLSQKIVIWCKYCGHGGHVSCYRKHFGEEKKTHCPHGCGHTCFTDADFQ